VKILNSLIEIVFTKSNDMQDKRFENIFALVVHLFWCCLKQFDAVISAMASGQAVDLSQMPPPPGETGLCLSFKLFFSYGVEMHSNMVIKP